MMHQPLELTVTSLSHDGRAVCRHDNRVIFVRGGLPGQRIAVRLEAEKKRFAEGVCLAVLEQGADCIAPSCPHAAECGGCGLQQLPYDKQLFWKRHFIVEALHRIAGVKNADALVADCLPSPLRWHYRNKVRFACAALNDTVTLGLRAAASHRVVPLTDCLLLPRGLAPLVQDIQEALRQAPLPPELWRCVTLRHPLPLPTGESPAPDAAQCLVQCLTRSPDAAGKVLIADMGRALMREHPVITGVVHETRDTDDTLAQGARTLTRLGGCVLHTELGGARFAYSHDSFFQINDGAAALLCREAQRLFAAHHAAGGVVWDLYCGVGAPGQSLVRAETPLHGVEFSKAAVSMAGHNAVCNHLSGCVYTAGDTRRVMRTFPAPQLVLTDPPRAGMHEDVCRMLCQSQAQAIIYISCNPATLARDITRLRSAYAVREVTPVDLFPQTPHVESIALLSAIKK